MPFVAPAQRPDASLWRLKARETPSQAASPLPPLLRNPKPHNAARSSVPSGRVGSARDDVFRSNEHFREALADREAADVGELEAKLGRKWVQVGVLLAGVPLRVGPRDESAAA